MYNGIHLALFFDMELTALDLKILYQINYRDLSISKSQILQDIFVLNELKYKNNGYFVDFGATDGIEHSNSYLLEKEYNWNGILCEPSKGWHKSLKQNRPNVIIDHRCVWSESGKKINFKQCEINTLSTIEGFECLDQYSENRKSSKTYSVETVTLTDLLKHHKAPKEIDYLSIDTEGSEYEILKNHNFEKYSFKVITCEHNFAPQRKNINDLLTAKGYKRKFKRGDQSDFEDWYVKV